MDHVISFPSRFTLAEMGVGGFGPRALGKLRRRWNLGATVSSLLRVGESESFCRVTKAVRSYVARLLRDFSSVDLRNGDLARKFSVVLSSGLIRGECEAPLANVALLVFAWNNAQFPCCRELFCNTSRTRAELYCVAARISARGLAFGTLRGTDTLYPDHELFSRSWRFHRLRSRPKPAWLYERSFRGFSTRSNLIWEGHKVQQRSGTHKSVPIQRTTWSPPQYHLYPAYVTHSHFSKNDLADVRERIVNGKWW